MTRSWVMLALGTCGQTASTTALYGLAYLIPAFQRDLGVSLAGAGLLVSCPIAGILLGLVGWGAVADRYGERLALSAGLFAATAAMAAAAAVADGGTALLGFLLAAAGAGGSSVNSASGRLVIGWFPPGRRGMAMGVRQASQPVGTAVAAGGLPPLGRGSRPARSSWRTGPAGSRGPRRRCRRWPTARVRARRSACAPCCAGRRARPSPCSPWIRRVRAPRGAGSGPVKPCPGPAARRRRPGRRPRTAEAPAAGTCGGCMPSRRRCACRSSW
ncbi:hypothetical protein GCM10009731_59480 [Streptomyces globosus]